MSARGSASRPAEILTKPGRPTETESRVVEARDALFRERGFRLSGGDAT